MSYLSLTLDSQIFTSKHNSLDKEQALMTELHIYLKKDNLTEDEEVNLETIKLTLTTYILIQQKIKS